MTEVRTTSKTGGEKGVKPQRHSLIPKEGLDTIAEVFAFGAEKYADHNWRKGYDWSKSYDAAIRHLTAWWAGETYDSCDEACEFLDETGPGTCRNHSGLSHLGHAGFHIMALATWQRSGYYDEFDDRYNPGFDDGSNMLESGSAWLAPAVWENVGYIPDGVSFSAGTHDQPGAFDFSAVFKDPMTLSLATRNIGAETIRLMFGQAVEPDPAVARERDIRGSHWRP